MLESNVAFAKNFLSVIINFNPEPILDFEFWSIEISIVVESFAIKRSKTSTINLIKDGVSAMSRKSGIKVVFPKIDNTLLYKTREREMFCLSIGVNAKSSSNLLRLGL